MEKTNLVAITTKDNKCIYVSQVKNISDKKLALLQKQALEHETEQEQHERFLWNDIKVLHKHIKELEHEIKVLKGEIDEESGEQSDEE
jgi:hypothetical protein